MTHHVRQIGDATLYLGDCLEILPALGNVDAVVTDPVWPNAPEEYKPKDRDPTQLFADMCRASYLITRRYVVVMRCDSDPRFLSGIPRGFKFFRSIQLPYVMPGYIGRVLGGDETAYWFGNPIKFAPSRQVVPGRAPAAQPQARSANGHPMSRAQPHFDWLVCWCSDAGKTVVDPFMGSGTTGVACAKLGRKFIGIEIEPKYYEIACKRIEQAYAQPDLFIESPKRAEQAGLLLSANCETPQEEK